MAGTDSRAGWTDGARRTRRPLAVDPAAGAADKIHPPGSDRNLELRDATFAIVGSGMEGGLSRDCPTLESAAKTVQTHLDAP